MMSITKDQMQEYITILSEPVCKKIEKIISKAFDLWSYEEDIFQTCVMLVYEKRQSDPDYTLNDFAVKDVIRRYHFICKPFSVAKGHKSTEKNCNAIDLITYKGDPDIISETESDKTSSQFEDIETQIDWYHFCNNHQNALDSTILKMLCCKKTVREIAERTGKTEKTIYLHWHAIQAKYDEWLKAS